MRAFFAMVLIMMTCMWGIESSSQEQHRGFNKPEFVAAADAPYFQNGKRRQRHWKNKNHEYDTKAQIGDVIDPGGDLLSGKNSMVIIGISDSYTGRREYIRLPLHLIRNNPDQQTVLTYLKKETQAKESPRLKEPAGKEAP